MPIVIMHDNGQLVGDLAQNAGNFATGQAQFQMAQQAQEMELRRAQSERQSRLEDLQFQREDDLNRYRMEGLDQRGQAARANQQSRESIAAERGQDAYDRAMLQHGDRQAALAAGIQAKQEAMRGQGERFDQADATRRYAVDQNVGARKYSSDQRLQGVEDTLDTRQNIADQTAANAADHGAILRQRAAELDFRRDQAMQSGDQRAAQTVLSSYMQEARLLQHEIDSDPYGLDPDKTAAARARLGVITPKMERSRAILENRAAGQQAPASPAALPPQGAMPAIGRVAPTSQPAAAAPASSPVDPVATQRKAASLISQAAQQGYADPESARAFVLANLTPQERQALGEP